MWYCHYGKYSTVFYTNCGKMVMLYIVWMYGFESRMFHMGEKTMKKEKLSDIMLEYKEKHGLSPEQMAERCGIHRSYYYRIINEEEPSTGLPPTVSKEKLALIAKGMGMTRDELMSRIEGKPMFHQSNFVDRPAYYVPMITEFPDSLCIADVIEADTKMYPLPKELHKEYKTVAYIVEDDSLSPDIQKSDIVIVWQGEEYLDGDYVLARREKDKSLHCFKISINNIDSPILFGNTSISPIVDFSSVTVIGKIVSVQRNYISIVE